MPKQFDYLEFQNHSFVFDAKKYSKEQALKIANEESDNAFYDYSVDDVRSDYVAYRFDPRYCQHEFGSNGAYFLVSEPKRGSFPVWVIDS